MADYPALPLWTDAYLADTRHLTRDQHGAYLLLLMEAWRRPNKSLPDDDALLARLTCSTAAEWQSLKPVVMAFWKLDKRCREWRQKRLSKEAEFLGRKRAVQRDKALKRWNETKINDATAMPGGMPNACPEDAPTPTPTPIIESTVESTVTARQDRAAGAALTGKGNGHDRPTRGSRLPAGWEPTSADRDYAAERGLDPDSIAEEFRDWWHAAAGQKGVKLDWSATWRTWCRRAAERVGSRRERDDGILAAGARAVAALKRDGGLG